MKPSVVAAALSTKTIDEQFEVYGEKGRYRVGGHTIRDTSPKEWMDLTTVIASHLILGLQKLVSSLGVKNFTTPIVSLALEVALRLAFRARFLESYENRVGRY